MIILPADPARMKCTTCYYSAGPSLLFKILLRIAGLQYCLRVNTADLTRDALGLHLVDVAPSNLCYLTCTGDEAHCGSGIVVTSGWGKL